MENFGLILIVSLCVVAISFVALGVQVFFGRKKKFPETSVGKNQEMKKRNIKCVKCEEFEHCKNIGK